MTDVGYVVHNNNAAEEIYRNEKGQIHREDDKPALIRVYQPSFSSIFQQDHLVADLMSKADKTTLYSYNWAINGSRHRDGDEPAYVSPEGKQWWVNGQTHRLNGPAEILYDAQDFYLPEDQRRVIQFSYYVRGKLHRWDGPAIVRPQVGDEEWWIDGKRIDRLKDILAEYEIEGPFTEWTDAEWMILRFALTDDLLKAS